MKIIGIIILVFSFSAAGFIKANEYTSVLKDLLRVETFIKNIILCLHNEHMSLPDIFSFISKNSDDKTVVFLSNLSPQNFNEAEKISSGCGFCKDKKANQILQETFFVLGKYSAEKQIYELDFCRSKIVSIYEKNEDKLKNRANFAKKAGFFLGLFVAVIFI